MAVRQLHLNKKKTDCTASSSVVILIRVHVLFAIFCGQTAVKRSVGKHHGPDSIVRIPLKSGRNRTKKTDSDCVSELTVIESRRKRIFLGGGLSEGNCLNELSVLEKEGRSKK